MWDPMLAHEFGKKEKFVTYPGYAQPKLNGMRAIFDDQALWSRMGNLIVSVPELQKTVQTFFSDWRLDGELYIHKKSFEDTISTARRTVNIEEDMALKYWIYDVCVDAPFDERWNTFRNFNDRLLMGRVMTPSLSRIQIVPTVKVNNRAELMAYFEKWVKEGFEGAMYRNAQATYQVGKRTKYLLKLKRFHDVEGRVISLIEGMGKHEGRLGAITCELEDGKIVSVGSGFSDGEREEIWDNGGKYLNRMVTIKYQELTRKGIPRFPTFVRFRDTME